MWEGITRCPGFHRDSWAKGENMVWHIKETTSGIPRNMHTDSFAPDIIEAGSDSELDKKWQRYLSVMRRYEHCLKLDQLTDPNLPEVMARDDARKKYIEQIVLGLQTIQNLGKRQYIPVKIRDFNLENNEFSQIAYDLCDDTKKHIEEVYQIAADYDEYPWNQYFVSPATIEEIPQSRVLIDIGPAENQPKCPKEFLSFEFYQGFSTFDLVSLAHQAYAVKKHLNPNAQEKE